MRIILIILVLFLNACQPKEDKREKLYLPHILHKKNVDIRLDDAFFRTISKHYSYPVPIPQSRSCLNKVAGMCYGNRYLADTIDFSKNSRIIKRALRIDTLFQYKETGLLVAVGSLGDYPLEVIPRNEDVQVMYFCFRSLEKRRGRCYLVDRFYIVSIKGKMIKDIMACNLPQDADNALHVACYNEGMDLTRKDWAKVRDLKGYRLLDLYYYINPEITSCLPIYKKNAQPESPITELLDGAKLVKSLYGTVDKYGNIEFGNTNLFLESHAKHNYLRSVEKMYNILPLKVGKNN